MPNRELARTFLRFPLDANSDYDPTVKACPRCSVEYRADEASLKNRKVAKKGLHVTCQACALEWCFTCHGAWHERLTCEEYRDEVLLRKWARERDKFHRDQANA